MAQRRMVREKKTVEAMVKMYCSAHHKKTPGLCGECAELVSYAGQRLDTCPFGEKKTTCAKCPVHCYSPSIREKITAVMRYSGPRMITKHPVLALRHVADSRVAPHMKDTQ